MSKLLNRGFLTVAIANLLLALPFYILMIYLPLYLRNGLGIEVSKIGVVLGMYSLAAVLMRPLAGYLLDRLPRKLVYLSSFTLYTICILLYPLVAGFVGAAILRFIHGLGWGGVNTSGSTLAIDSTPLHRRGEGIGLYGISMSIATLIGPLIGHALYGFTESYTFIFVSSFCISAFALLLGSTFPSRHTPSARPHQQPNQQKRYPLKHFLTALLSRKALPAGIFTLVAHIPYGFMTGYIALYASQLHGGANVGLYFTLYAIATLIARYFSGLIFDRHGAKLLVPTTVSLTALGFIILGAIPSQVGLYLAAFPLGIGFGSVMNAGQSIANYKVEERERGRANSTFLTLFDIGIGIGTFTFGAIIDALGFQPAIYIAAFLHLLSLLPFYLLHTAPRD